MLSSVRLLSLCPSHSTVGFRQREYHEASLTAFRAHKHFYTDHVVPLLAEQKDVEAALQKMEPKAAQDAEVRHPLCPALDGVKKWLFYCTLCVSKALPWAHTSFCFLTHA